MDVTRAIREFRQVRGLTAANVARAVGLTPTRMIQLETTPADVRLGTLARLAAFYRIPLWGFVGELMGAFKVWDQPVAFESKVRMVQAESGVISLYVLEGAYEGQLVARFIPSTTTPGEWIHIEERSNGPAGLRRMVRLRAPEGGKAEADDGV